MTTHTTATSSLPSTGTLLGVWAHPDDEAFLSSALMASAHASQTDQLAAVLGEERVAQWWATESLVDASRRTA
jgi:hypothetical protein